MVLGFIFIINFLNYTIERIFLQETFVIEDTIAYSDCTTDSVENIFNVPSNVKNSTYEFNSNGWKYGNVSSYTSMILQSSITVSTPISISLKVIENYNNGFTLTVGKVNNSWVNLYIENNQLCYRGNYLKTPSIGAEYSIKIYSDKIEVYENDTLLTTDNSTLSEWIIGLETGNNRYVRIKDFKIKVL